MNLSDVDAKFCLKKGTASTFTTTFLQGPGQAQGLECKPPLPGPAVAVLGKNIWGAWPLIIWEATAAKGNLL